MTASSSAPQKKPVRKTTDGFSRARKAASEATAKPTLGSAPKAASSKSSSKPATKPAPSSATAVKKAQKPVPARPEKPLTVSRGRFIDFAPPRPRTPSAASERLSAAVEPESNTKSSVDAQKSRPPVARPPRSKVPVKRPVRISTAYSNMPQMETPTRVVRQTTVITTADSMPEIAPSARVNRPPRRPARITYSGAVNLPSAPAKKPAPAPRPTVSRQPLVDPDVDFFADTPPQMNDDDLAAALAGFADDEDYVAPSLSDNLSKEANDFAEEIDALDGMDSLSDEILNGKKTVGDALQDMETEDFISEPRTLFDADAEDAAPARPARSRTPLNYSPTGDRSPFISSVNVEKRPLSAAGLAGAAAAADAKVSLAAPVGSAAKVASAAGAASGSASGAKAAIRPLRHTHKNVYRAKSEEPTYTSRRDPVSSREDSASPSDDSRHITRAHETIIISPTESKTRSLGLIVAIILTILLGAGVGALIYLAFFQ